MILMTYKGLHPSTGSAYVMDGVAKITTVNAILFAFSSGCYGMKLRVVDIPVGCRPPKLTVVIPSTPPFNEKTFNVTGNGQRTLPFPFCLSPYQP